jgi:hypothetical protein
LRRAITYLDRVGAAGDLQHRRGFQPLALRERGCTRKG